MIVFFHLVNRGSTGADDRRTATEVNEGTVKPAPFAYLRPGSLAEAVAALAGDPGAKVLAGGQSLVPLLSMRLAAPVAARRHQRRCPGSTRSTADEPACAIGALARHADVLAAPTYAGCSRWSRWR